ncbi:hypothetical protein PV326_007309 [Microctonus aethiopoides]|nr:hypothetical protein PV326_007309 [Microctonus aethiopoides]
MVGLFHKAIIQSGVAINPWASSSEPPMESVKKLAAVLDKDISDVKEFVNYLRTLDVHRLVEAEDKIRTSKDKILFIYPFLPSVDLKAKNSFLTKPPDEAAKDGIQVSLMNEDICNEIDADIDNLLIHPTILRYLKKHNVSVNDFKQYYFDELPISFENMDEIVNAFGAVHFTIGIHNVIEIQKRIPNVPAYLYKFEYEMNNSLAKKFMGPHIKGTFHGEELSYLFYSKLAVETFNQQPPAPGSIEHKLIQRFTKLWTNFAKTGLKTYWAVEEEACSNSAFAHHKDKQMTFSYGELDALQMRNPTPKQTDIIPVQWQPLDHSNDYNFMQITDELAMGVEKNIIQQLIKVSNDKPCSN